MNGTSFYGEECILLLNNEIGILPYFKKSSLSITQTVWKAMNMHHRISKLDPVPPLIPPLKYTYIQLNEAFFEDYLNQKITVLPKASMDYLFDQSEEYSQLADLTASFERYKSSLIELEKYQYTARETSPQRNYINGLGKQLEFLTQSVPRNRIPILIYPLVDDLSIQQEHVRSMGAHDEWLLQLIEWFHTMTQGQVYIDKEQKYLSFDSFLFDSNGGILAFIAFDLLENELSWSKPLLSLKRVEESNLRSFRSLISSFYDYYYSRAESSHPPIFEHDARFARFYKAMDRFESFQHMLDYMQGRDLGKREQRIGVFLDVANIYYGIQDMSIHFHNLFSAVLGTPQPDEAYVPLFVPTHTDERKANIANKWVERLDRELRSYGFEPQRVSNGQEKAKKYIEQLAHDVDDQYLIRKLDERFDRLDSILLLTGDDDLFDAVMKYKVAGKKVKVISVHEDNTSNRYITEFKENHSFITDYWDCISLTNTREDD